VIATAIKDGKAHPDVIASATHSMATLNRGAAEIMREMGVRAATDVTGFGLLGHLRQMLEASGVAAWIEEAEVPILPGAMELAESGRFPGGSVRNLTDMGEDVLFPKRLPQHRRLLLADAQTSGGLLMAVSDDSLPELLERLKDRAPVAAVIGKIEAGPPGRIRIV
jgi:selenide,water dikinase